MKKIIIPILCLLIIGFAFYKSGDITDYLANKFSKPPKLVIPENNEYAKEYSYRYVQLADSYIPYSYQDLKNILFTIINNGWESFTFYCPSEYENCLNDIKILTDDKNPIVLSYINGFVHPFNSFSRIKASIASNGEIMIAPVYLYSKEQIEEINTKVDEIIANSSVMAKSSSSAKEKIKYFHDYIINHTKYDVNYDTTISNNPSPSRNAYGALFNGIAICSGYSDLMAIILDKLGIPNYKIATIGDHIWNAVKIDNNWYHLDLTWDDPVASDGNNYLFYSYFLISTNKLKKIDNDGVKIEDHNFDDTVYLEFNPLT